MKPRVLLLSAFSATTLLTPSACTSITPQSPSASETPVIVTETASPVTTTRVHETTSTQETSIPSISPTITPTTSSALSPLGTPDAANKQRSPEGEFDMTVTGVRVADHESFTRVVFDIAGASKPGWWVDWTQNPVQQASGLPVDIAGDSFLDVNIEGITYPSEATAQSVEIGSFKGAGVVQEVQLTSIFEARAQFLIGVSGSPKSYSVSLLENPTRIVVDIQH